MNKIKEFNEVRDLFYVSVPQFWPDLYGDEYALYDIYRMEAKQIDDIRLATGRIGGIFFKVGELLRKVPDETLIEMGYPLATIRFLRWQTMKCESVIARLDLVVNGESIKCLELNADTPTFIKELFYVNNLVCKEKSVQSPNLYMEQQLKQAINQAITEMVEKMHKEDPYIVFTSHQDHVEDYHTVLYLKDLTDFPANYVPLHKLYIVNNQGLYDENGRKIDILYRQTFPIESLIEDQDEKGNPIGLWLLSLIESGKLAIINPPSAFLLQNKAVQAVIWGLHENKDPFFSQQEHEWIHTYFLPTYLEAEALLDGELPFVKKPVFGREGNTVEIYNGSGELIAQDINKSYTNYIPVFQQFIELPKTTFQTKKGMKEGHYIIGSFLLNGKSAAIGLRAGNLITDNLSYFLPVGMMDSQE